MTATARSQPHRMGDTDAARVDHVGRMIRDEWRNWFPDHDPRWTQQELLTAAETFHRQYWRVQHIHGLKRPLANETRSAPLGELTDEQLREERDRAEAVLRDARNAMELERYRVALQYVLIDFAPEDHVWPHYVKEGVKMALCSLAAHYAEGRRIKKL